MSFGFRAKEKPSLRDRLRGKSSDQVLEELRRKIDQDKEMFFDRVPNPPSFGRAGFPFDDNGSISRGRPDFRHRLEEIAQQHPEFADSLRPWYTEQPPDGMGWTFRQRTGSGSNGPSPQPQQQPESKTEPSEECPSKPAEQPSRGPGLPQHGLRNTVDIGEAQQAHAQMEANDPAQDERGKRAQSAPPDNPSKEQPRYVFRLDVNPEPEQSASHDGNAAKPPVAPKQVPAPPQQPPQQTPKPASTVRQIPIFVEGRDEPVMAKHDVDSAPSASSNFGQPFAHHSFSAPGFSRQGGIHDNLRFGDAPRYTSSMHHHFNPSEPQAQKRPFPQQHQQPPSSRNMSRPNSKEQAHPQQQPPAPQQHQQQHQQPPREETPPAEQVTKPKEPPKPKDALVKVQEVRDEVESLAEQVEAYSGHRQDKQYLYLDEMLTRNLIKLDVIETEGRDDVRTARKETIRAIQQCISKLESKVMTPEEKEAREKAQQAMETEEQSEASTEAMEAEPSQTPDVKTEPAPAPCKEPESPAPSPAPAPDSESQENTASSSQSQPSVPQQPMDVTSDTTTVNNPSLVPESS